MAAGIFVTPTRDVCFTTNASDSKKVALISHTFLLESYYSYLSYLFIMYRKSTWETHTFEMLLANLLDMIVPPTKAKFAMDLDNMTTDALSQARWFFMAVLNMIESSESLGQHGTARFFVTYGRMQVRRRQGTRFAPCFGRRVLLQVASQLLDSGNEWPIVWCRRCCDGLSMPE